jgi:hypothetical protein
VDTLMAMAMMTATATKKRYAETQLELWSVSPRGI